MSFKRGVAKAGPATAGPASKASSAKAVLTMPDGYLAPRVIAVRNSWLDWALLTLAIFFQSLCLSNFSVQAETRAPDYATVDGQESVFYAQLDVRM